MHHDQQITILRNQNQTNVVTPDFAKTSRKCPPFCIQPGELAPGVKTIAELEVLHFLQQIKERNHECVFEGRNLYQRDSRRDSGSACRAHGITLSNKQYEYASRKIREEGLQELVTLELKDYRDLEGEEWFDKIASVGMFEHVGLKNLPVYFATAHRLLKSGGLFLNHGITSDEEGWQKTASTEFINRYVFPDGEMDTVSNIQRAMERTQFEILDVEALRPHYALTLRHWVKRLEEHREEALQHVSEATYRVWHLYMVACAIQFEEGDIGLSDSGGEVRDVAGTCASHATGCLSLSHERCTRYCSNGQDT